MYLDDWRLLHPCTGSDLFPHHRQSCWYLLRASGRHTWATDAAHRHVHHTKHLICGVFSVYSSSPSSSSHLPNTNVFLHLPHTIFWILFLLGCPFNKLVVVSVSPPSQTAACFTRHISVNQPLSASHITTYSSSPRCYRLSTQDCGRSEEATVGLWSRRNRAEGGMREEGGRCGGGSRRKGGAVEAWVVTWWRMRSREEVDVYDGDS